MGNNSKNNQIDRTFGNVSPSNKKSGGHHQVQHGSQRPSPSKSINIKTPNKNNSSNAGYTKQQQLNGSRSSGGSCSPNSSYFAGSKCFESPRAIDLPKPPSSWFSETEQRTLAAVSKVRKSLILSESSCATEYARTMKSYSYSSFNTIDDHYTQNLKLLLNVHA